MDITIGIPTWNRCEALARTLDSLTSIEIPDGVTWRVVVVDNNCTDNTQDVLRRFANRLPLRVEFEPTPGVSHARNRILQIATGDYLMWIDDDVVLDPGWLSGFVECARRNPDAAAFGGPVVPRYLEALDPLLVEVFALQTGFGHTDYGPVEKSLAAHQLLYTVNFAVARRAVEGLRYQSDLGRTPDSPMGCEDTEYVKDIHRAGGQVIWCPRMALQHVVPASRTTWRYLKWVNVGFGRNLAWHQGCGDTAQWGGVPRWVLRRLAEEYVGAGLHFALGRRRAWLTHTRRACLLAGMVQQYWQMARVRRAAAQLGSRARVLQQAGQ